MPIIASESTNKPKQLPPDGTHLARCYSVIDLGTQQTPFGESRKVRLTWELPTEKVVFDEDKGKQPFVISREYTLSLHEKSNLRHDLERWRGREFTEKELKGFDMMSLLGVPCLVTIIHKTSDNGKAFARMDGVSAVPKNTVFPDQINPSVSYSIEDGANDVYQALPEWLRKKIDLSSERSTDVKQQDEPNPFNDDSDSDEVPFK